MSSLTTFVSGGTPLRNPQLVNDERTARVQLGAVEQNVAVTANTKIFTPNRIPVLRSLLLLHVVADTAGVLTFIREVDSVETESQLNNGQPLTPNIPYTFVLPVYADSWNIKYSTNATFIELVYIEYLNGITPTAPSVSVSTSISYTPSLFVKDLTVGTTAVQVDTDSTIRSEVTLFADVANTGTIKVGTTTAQLFPLAAGDALSLRVVRLSDIYVVATAANQILHVIAGGI